MDVSEKSEPWRWGDVSVERWAGEEGSYTHVRVMYGHAVVHTLHMPTNVSAPAVPSRRHTPLLRASHLYHHSILLHPCTITHATIQCHSCTCIETYDEKTGCVFVETVREEDGARVVMSGEQQDDHATWGRTYMTCVGMCICCIQSSGIPIVPRGICIACMRDVFCRLTIVSSVRWSHAVPWRVQRCLQV